MNLNSYDINMQIEDTFCSRNDEIFEDFYDYDLIFTEKPRKIKKIVENGANYKDFLDSI